MLTQLPRVPSLIPSSLATRAIGREVSITIFTASSRNSGEKLFFGPGNYFTFPDIHPNGWTVRKPRGTPGVPCGQLVLDDPGCQEVLALGDARPDGLGGELALALAELGLERPFCRGKLADDVLPGCRVDAPVLEGVPAVL